MHITGTLIFLFVVIFCIGAAIGGVIERALKRPSTVLPAPPLPPPVEMPLPIVDKNPLAEAEDVEVLSAWRTRTNQVWLAMDGTRLNDKTALQPGQAQRLLSLVMDLRPWLETVRPAAPKAEAIPQPVRPATPAPAPAPTLPPVPVEKKNGAPAAEAAAPAPVLDSIIQQIDVVLQAKLNTSAFKNREIQLVEGPGGIVIVRDGSNRYEGLVGIPDPEV